jgi:hypothetical protein
MSDFQKTVEEIKSSKTAKEILKDRTPENIESAIEYLLDHEEYELVEAVKQLTKHD